jgi:hypothetical protein
MSRWLLWVEGARQVLKIHLIYKLQFTSQFTSYKLQFTSQFISAGL